MRTMAVRIKTVENHSNIKISILLLLLLLLLNAAMPSRKRFGLNAQRPSLMWNRPWNFNIFDFLKFLISVLFDFGFI